MLTGQQLGAVVDAGDKYHQQEAHSADDLADAVAGIATTANDTPEHNFLIGLAYLEGIDVELNRQRGLELVTSAAENNLPEAMEKLYNMYLIGLWVPLNYKKAAFWLEALVER